MSYKRRADSEILLFQNLPFFCSVHCNLRLSIAPLGRPQIDWKFCWTFPLRDWNKNKAFLWSNSPIFEPSFSPLLKSYTWLNYGLKCPIYLPSSIVMTLPRDFEWRSLITRTEYCSYLCWIVGTYNFYQSFGLRLQRLWISTLMVGKLSNTILINEWSNAGFLQESIIYNVN